MAFLPDFISELTGPFLSLLKILLGGLEDNSESIKRNTHTRLHLKETALDVLVTLTRPSIRAKDTSKETGVDDGIDASDNVPDGRKSLSNKGRRTDEDTLSLSNGFHDLVKRSIDDVVDFNIEVLLLKSSLNGVSKSLSELICSGISDHDERIARARNRSRPAAIEVKIELEIFTKDRTVAAADGLKLNSLELLQTIKNVLLERTKDAIKVVLVSAEHVFLHLGILGDLIVEDERIAVVSTKEVAGDDGLDLRDVSDHGIRPVKERSNDEVESVTTNVNRSTLLVDNEGLGELAVADELDVADSSIGTDNGGVRIALHEKSESTTVIRLSVIENDVIDLLITLQNSLDPLFKLSKVSLLDSLEEHVGLLTLEEEAVVSSTEGSLHDNIKKTELRVQSTNPVKVLLNNKSLILSSSHDYLVFNN